jgi:hypothetical protein
MEVAITTLLTLIEGLLPSLGVGSASLVDKILVALISIVPIIAANASNLIIEVQGIIAALQASGNVTADQMAQLAALDAQCDAAFAAAAGPDAPDPAPQP